MTAIRDLIKRGVVWPYRRLSIKRLQTDGTYESNWYDISPYVVRWGTVKKSYTDAVYLGDNQIDGVNVVLNNSERRFNAQTERESLFWGFLTRYRTKFKIEFGLYDDDGSEVPGLTWYGILYSEPTTSDSGEISLSVASVLKTFQNYTAYGISTASGTTAQLVDRIVKRTQGGVRIFDQFFEGATDADRYKINTAGDAVTTISSPSVREDNTSWSKISDYSTFDNFVAYVNSSGAFVWAKKSQSSTVQWVFNGAGSFDGTYGQNIVSIPEEVDGINNTWTRVTIEYQSQLFATSAATWTPGDMSVQDVYGERTFSAQYFDLTALNAATVAASIRTAYQTPKREWSVITPPIPHLEINDLVTINYVGQISERNPFILGLSTLDGDSTLSRYLNSINLSGVSAKIIGISIDLDELSCEFRLREV